MIFIGKISKGHNSLKNVSAVLVLFLCTSSDGGLYRSIVVYICTKSHENILDGIKVIERTRFS